MPTSRFYQKYSAVAVILAFTVVSHARPIRVGIFKGTGQSRYWHTSTHTAGSAIAAILANPQTANLGPDLMVPAQGFVTAMFGVGTDSQPPATTGSPSPAQIAAFISALDTLDVVWISSFTDIGGSIKDTTQRKRLATFIRTKGFVSIHGNIDSYGTWATWDSIHGTRFQSWTTTTPQATLHLDTVSRGDPNLRFLNRGLPDTARFNEEWMSFTTNGDVIRANSGLKVAVRLDEASVNGGLGGSRAMGADHPMSWFRELSGGGRFFFTALGHRTDTYTGGTNTSFVRRTLYNAILWAAGADSNGVVGLRPGGATRMAKGPEVRVSRSEIHVQVAEAGATVELYSLNGMRLAHQNSRTGGTVTFDKPLRAQTLVVRIQDLHGIRSVLVVP